MATISEALAMAFALHERGELAQAEQIYRRILDIEPANADVLHRLGVLVLQSGRADEAVMLLERTVALDPRDGGMAANLGAAYTIAGRHEAARKTLAAAVERDPSNAGAFMNLGNTLYLLGRLDEAAVALQSCLHRAPGHGTAHGNLGVVLQDLGRIEEAQTCYERAVELNPDQAMAHANLGTLLKDRGQLTAALDCFARALAIQPDCQPALCGRGTLLLSQGDFAAGWADYENRIGCPQFNTLRFPQPRWDGSPFADGTLLIHCEQGLGDTFQFIRYVKLVAQRARKIVVACEPQLIPLLSASGVSGLVDRKGPLPPFDMHAPLMSLPLIFGTTLNTIPRGVPYLAVDEGRIAKWRQDLGRYEGLKVGIAWQGAKSFARDRTRSIPLEQFAPLANVPGVRLFSLQKGQGSEQLATLANRFPVVDLARDLDPPGEAFLDTAAVMKCLDLVVTSDSAPAHLAGALGVKVWVALARVPEWRWMLERTDSPWYPTMRLFRQRQSGDWLGAFANMADELAKLAGGTS